MFKSMREKKFRPGNGKKIGIIAAISVALLAVFAFFSYEVTKASVTLVIDGEKQTIRTHAQSVEELLTEQSIDFKEHDLIVPAGNTELSNNMEVTYERAVPATVIQDGIEKDVYTTADTVSDLFKELKIEVGEHDKLSPALDTALTADMEISLQKAFQVAFHDGNEKKEAWTTSTTVADFLKQHDVKLNELDKVKPAKDQLISKDTTVKIIRVEKVTDVVEEPVDYAVVTRKDENLKKGKEKVLESGEKGKVEKHYEVVLENGKEVSRKLVKTDTVKESKDRIVAVGTKVISKPVSRGTDYKQTSTSKSTAPSGNSFYVSSTAYTASCNGCSGVTATGINLKSNPNAKVIAVDPSVIPLGTRVYVEGYGYATAADTGGAIKGHKIDVFFSSKSHAYSWGRRTVKVTILK